jgi:hypothetical protein
MIIGFNHNVTYRGAGFHVQTEDSGPKNPNLVTLLYHGGTIIASKKTVYADILKVDNLEMVIEDLAKEQHKGMLRSLTHGDFDERIVAMGISLAGIPGAAGVQKTTAVPPGVAPEAVSSTDAAVPLPHATVSASETEQGVKIEAEQVVDRFRKVKPEEMGLEELVLAYLTAGQQES